MIPRLGRTRGLFADWYCERTYDPRPMPVGHKPAPGDNSHEHSTPLKSAEPHWEDRVVDRVPVAAELRKSFLLAPPNAKQPHAPSAWGCL